MSPDAGTASIGSRGLSESAWLARRWRFLGSLRRAQRRAHSFRISKQLLAVGAPVESRIDEGRHRGERGTDGSEHCGGSALSGELAPLEPYCRVTQGSSDFDRRAQHREAELLGLSRELQIQSLVVQIDVAQAGDDHDLSVEDNLSDFRNAVVCVEICDAAAQSRLLLVLLQQEPQATRHIDSGELGEGLLDLSVRNHDRERPVRGGGKGMHRIAMAMHLQSPDESA